MLKKKSVDMVRKHIKRVPKKHFPHLDPKGEICWEAAEFHYYPKNKYWIMGIGIMILGLIFLFIAVAQYLHYDLSLPDYLFMVSLAMMIIIFGQYGHIEPKRYAAELRQDGMLTRGKLYSYESFKSFWIIENPTPIAYFEPVKIGLPVVVLLDDQDVEEIRNYLLRYLPEHPTATEHITDKLNHFLRF